MGEEVIKEILNCARLAPTAINIEPWLFGAVSDNDLERQIADLTDQGEFIKDGVVCFAVFADSTKKYFLEDGCAATENILLAWTAYEIGSCWVAGHNKAYVDFIRELPYISQLYILIALITAGYSTETASPQQEVPRWGQLFQEIQGMRNIWKLIGWSENKSNSWNKSLS